MVSAVQFTLKSAINKVKNISIRMMRIKESILYLDVKKIEITYITQTQHTTHNILFDFVCRVFMFLCFNILESSCKMMYSAI